VLRLEVRLAAARQEAAAARLAVSEAESSLNLLMGRPPGTPLPLAGEEVVIGAGLPLDLDLLYEQAEAGRLDLLAAAHGVRRAGFQREASRAERYPALRAFASYDIDGPEPALETDLDSYLVGVGLRLPISVSTSARIRQAEAREDELREELRSLALSVTREVRDAWEALEVARETLALARAAVDTAAEAFRIVAAAQDAGGATVTDVLEAEDARRKAQVRFVAARAAVEMVRARLVAATGGVR
jgi:outer membrane protein TolC